MKRLSNYCFAAILGLIFSMSFTACSDDNGDDTKKDELKKQEERDKAYAEIVDAFIHKTVVPTYEKMALKWFFR